MIQKFLYTAIFSAILLSCNTTDKKEEVKTNDVNEITTIKQQKPTGNIDTITDITSAYEKTMDLLQSKSVDSSSFRYNCGGEKSGTVIFYRKDNELILIEKRYAEYSHTEGKNQYFINKGEPFFVYQKETNWSFDSNSNVEGATIDKIKESRFYIVKNQLVNCLEKQYELSSTEKNKQKPNQISNSKTPCPSLDKVLAEYQKLLNYKSQESDIDCL